MSLHVSPSLARAELGSSDLPVAAAIPERDRIRAERLPLAEANGSSKAIEVLFLSIKRKSSHRSDITMHSVKVTIQNLDRLTG